MGLTVYTGDGGFYHWIELPKGLTADEFNKRLFKKGAAILKASRSRNKIVMPKLLPKTNERIFFSILKSSYILGNVRLVLLRGLATAICQNISIQLFRITLLVCNLGEVTISYIFCFILRDLLTFIDKIITMKNARAWVSMVFTQNE